MNKKQKNELLVGLAGRALQETKALFKEGSMTDIPDSYNGQISAFGVSVAMSGLRPALAMYYQDKSNTKVYKYKILVVIAKMLHHYDSSHYPHSGAKGMLEAVLKVEESSLSRIQADIIDCSIALKQVVRTYNLV